MYPLEVRGKGSATGSITETGTFWQYGVSGIIGILFFFRVVPETKGRTLEEIEEELERRTSTGSDTEAAGSGPS
ncbi:hypothetical protein BH18ACT11_BH18ACT11_12430 [soil metagenome]